MTNDKDVFWDREMTPEKEIIKYLKVKALADRGSPGERDNAQKILAKMEQTHPKISRDAALFQLGREPSEPNWNNQQKQPDVRRWGDTGNWENIFRWAGSAFNDFTEHVANLSVARRLAQEITSSMKMSRQGNVILSLKMPLWVYEHTFELNPIQKQFFRQKLHELLDEEINSFLGD